MKNSKTPKRLTVKNAFKIMTGQYIRCSETGSTLETHDNKPTYSVCIEDVLEEIENGGYSFNEYDLNNSSLYFYGDSDYYDENSEAEPFIDISGPKKLLLKLKIEILKKHFPEEKDLIKEFRREILEESPLRLVESNFIGKSDSQSPTFIGRNLKAV